MPSARESQHPRKAPSGEKTTLRAALPSPWVPCPCANECRREAVRTRLARATTGDRGAPWMEGAGRRHNRLTPEEAPVKKQESPSLSLQLLKSPAPNSPVAGVAAGGLLSPEPSPQASLLLLFETKFSRLFISERQRQTEREQGRSRERGRQNPQQVPGSEPSAQSPTRGSNSRAVRS